VKALVGGGAACALVVAFAAPAVAQDTIRDPGLHPSYPVEVEPHAVVGWNDFYGGSGIGAGLRLSIPIVQNGFIKSIDDSVAIGFGADWLHYSGCYYRGECTANYLIFPVALQWNFFFTRRWSAFGEPGLFLYKGFVDRCSAPGCGEPASFGVEPALAVGGRYAFTDNVTFTLRLGYPTFSAGLSFL
jgi:hypothetical protein